VHTREMQNAGIAVEKSASQTPLKAFHLWYETPSCEVDQTLLYSFILSSGKTPPYPPLGLIWTVM